MRLLQRRDKLWNPVCADVHRPHFVLERQQVNCVVPRVENLELVQQLLGFSLHVERRTPLRKWRYPDIRNDADD